MVLPRISKLAQGERLRGLRRGLKVLFMSGYSDRRRVETSKLAASALIHQPLLLDALGEQLRA